MKTTSKTPGTLAKALGLLGLGLCAICCALPIIGIIGGAGLLTGLSIYPERLAVVLLIISLAVLAIAYYRKKKAPSCDINCDCKTEDHKPGSINLIN